ncbi:hypothetical protein HanRHA438_Chr16g0747811 [Helianthus annuus]|nr:hypothetical protein HanRHA438_Chr16g0747811 [Helianthus annuus]
MPPTPVENPKPKHKRHAQHRSRCGVCGVIWHKRHKTTSTLYGQWVRFTEYDDDGL